VVAARHRDVGGSLAVARRWRQRDSATVRQRDVAWRRCGGGVAAAEASAAVAAASLETETSFVSVSYLGNGNAFYGTSKFDYTYFFYSI